MQIELEDLEYQRRAIAAVVGVLDGQIKNTFDIRNSAFGIPPVPPFNDSDWFRKGDDVRWQWRGATWTTNGSPQGERNQAHQYHSSQRGNANFAFSSLPHSNFRLRTLNASRPTAWPVLSPFIVC